jgi:hypothetical protein
MAPNDQYFSLLFPPFSAAALIEAGQAQDFDKLDQITDSLADRGLCRPRSDVSLFPESHLAERAAAFTAGSSKVAAPVAPIDGYLPGVVVQVITHKGTTARWQRD